MERNNVFLQAAAEAVERQAAESPALGIPVDPDVAEYMGAFEEKAFYPDDFIMMEE
ncbi:hypothetical protein LJB86_02310 [Deltaproteobacteria bacterium OttesenSCG-928-M10]|nr:hypothetical protein [Deltaproteobacteria bacterium OttesenSCG-928-M10]